MPAQVNFTHVNRMKVLYERSRINVNVERGSTFTFTSDQGVGWGGGGGKQLPIHSLK